MAYSLFFSNPTNLLVFDFSGTLAHLKEFDLDIFFKKLEDLGLFLRRDKEKKEFVEICTGFWGWSENWLDLSQKILKNYFRSPTKSSVKNLARLLKENIVFELYDDVREIIDLPFKKAILSTNARFLIRGLGLGKFFKIFTPRETKFLKPDKRAFLAVLKKLKTKAEQAIMIGDELKRDLLPARELGMRVILIDREDKIKETSIKKIHSLKELRKLF